MEETPINKINRVNNEIDSLKHEKEEILSKYQLELLQHDLEQVSLAIGILGSLNTEKASELVEEYEVIDVVEDVAERLKEKIADVEKEEGFIQRQLEDNP